MKETKITLYTKFRKLYKTEEEDGKRIEITKELEEEFHKFIMEKIRNIIEFDEIEFIEEFMEYSDCYFEGFDSLKDYGKFEIIEEGERQ